MRADTATLITGGSGGIGLEMARLRTAADEPLMLDGGLTRVVVLTNQAMVPGNRLLPRSLLAAVPKRLLRPLEIRGSAT